MTSRQKLIFTTFLLAIFCLAHALDSNSTPHTTSCAQCELGYGIQTPLAIQSAK